MGKCAFMDQNDNQPIHCLDVNSDSQEVSISLVYSLNSASKSDFRKCIKSHHKAVSISKINPRVSYNCKYESLAPMQCSVYLVTTDFPHIMTGDLCCHSTGVCVTPEALSAQRCQDKSWDKNIPQNSWRTLKHTPLRLAWISELGGKVGGLCFSTKLLMVSTRWSRDQAARTPNFKDWNKPEPCQISPH